jgi:FAD-linked sulfhydryl oxidase
MKYIIFALLLTNIHANFLTEVTPEGECECACNDLDRDKLGESTWYLVHEIVKHADPEYDPAFMMLMKTLGVLYPCEQCRDHILEYLGSRRVEMTEKWVCEFHNAVNVRLNKTIVDCGV